MSLLEQQMKELQMKQQKVVFLRDLLGLLQGKEEPGKLTTSEKMAENEISHEVQDYLQSKIDQIENGKEVVMTTLEASGISLSEEEVLFVREMFTRASSRGVFQEEQSAPQSQQQQNDPMTRRRTPPQQPPRNPQNPQQQRGRKDLLAFAMEFKHLHGKRVIARDQNGDKHLGTVTGAEAPNLWVRLDTGHSVAVLPENISME